MHPQQKKPDRDTRSRPTGFHPSLSYTASSRPRKTLKTSPLTRKSASVS